MKRILVLVLAAILLSTLAPAMAEDIVISYDGVSVGFTVPTGSPLFPGISTSGEYYFSMIAPMEYGGQARVSIWEDTVDGWIADKLAYFQDKVANDQNTEYSNPQVIGPAVWTLESGAQAQVLSTSAEYQSILSKALPGQPVYVRYEYYVAIPLCGDLILIAEFDYSSKVGEEPPINDEIVLSVLNNLTITLPAGQEAAPVEAASVEAAPAPVEAAPAPAPAGQDGLIVANMQDGLVLEDSRFMMVADSDDRWDVYLFLAIRNDSSETIALDGGWKAVDANGNELSGNEYISCYPDELAPGAVGYLAEWDYVTTDEIPSRESVSRVEVNLGADEYLTGYTYGQLDISGELLKDVGYFEDMLRCTITNTGSEWAQSPELVAAIYDQNNKLAYVHRTRVSVSQDLYIPAGQQLVMDIGIPGDVSEYFNESGVTLSSFRLMCYSESY